jgi:hypothetical protein
MKSQHQLLELASLATSLCLSSVSQAQRHGMGTCHRARGRVKGTHRGYARLSLFFLWICGCHVTLDAGTCQRSRHGSKTWLTSTLIESDPAKFPLNLFPQRRGCLRGYRSELERGAKVGQGAGVRVACLALVTS